MRWFSLNLLLNHSQRLNLNLRLHVRRHKSEEVPKIEELNPQLLQITANMLKLRKMLL